VQGFVAHLQLDKQPKINRYDHLTEKEAEAILWEELCEVLIEPYHVISKTSHQDYGL